MKIDLEDCVVIDNHAHSLSKRHMELDSIEFRRAFSESSSLTYLEKDFPNSLHYRSMLRHLSRLIQFESEDDLINRRQNMNSSDYVNRLWDAVSVGALLVDDGLHPDQFIPVGELSDLCHRPIYRIVRIESVLEDAILNVSSFDELESKFELSLLSSLHGRIVAVKTIAAYRGGLSLEPVSRDEAAKDFQEFSRTLSSSKEAGGRIRIERCPFYHYFLFKTFELAADHDLPVQIHTGFGDTDLQLDQSNPVLLTPIFRSKRFARARFVLLHCYPYVREASYLCSVFPNVYMDLSLGLGLGALNADSIILEALSLAPPSKIFMGTDGHTIPETHWYGAWSMKRALSNVLTRLVAEDFIGEEDALLSAEQMLFRNAGDLYDLEGLK